MHPHGSISGHQIANMTARFLRFCASNTQLLISSVSVRYFGQFTCRISLKQCRGNTHKLSLHVNSSELGKLLGTPHKAGGREVAAHFGARGFKLRGVRTYSCDSPGTRGSSGSSARRRRPFFLPSGSLSPPHFLALPLRAPLFLFFVLHPYTRVLYSRD